MKGLNIVFAGTPKFGLPCLEALQQSRHSIQAVYTQPDRPAGRSRQLQGSAVKLWASKQAIPVYQPLHFKTPESVENLMNLKPDVMVVIAYGLILPQNLLQIPTLGCINVHASLLPKWRGASPIQQALLHGEDLTGISLMQMDAGLDTGDILSKATCAIFPTDTAGSLHDRLAQLAVQPLLTTLDLLANHQAQREVQDNDLATYAPKIKKEEARLSWQDRAVDLDKKIRAFNPWPIAYTHLADQVLRIYQAQVLEKEVPKKPGTILQIDEQGLLVATGEQSLLVTKIQFPSAKVISVADWLHSGKARPYVGYVLQ